MDPIGNNIPSDKSGSAHSGKVAATGGTTAREIPSWARAAEPRSSPTASKTTALEAARGYEQLRANWATAKDLIDPRKLKGLQPGEDYVLLIHLANPSSRDQIVRDGLHSVDSQSELPKPPFGAAVPGASGKSATRFGEDASMISFQPYISLKETPLNARCHLVAVHPSKATVCDRGHRWRDDQARYVQSACPVNEYAPRSAALGPGEILTKTLQPIDADCARINSTYLPEVCVNASAIDASMLVPDSDWEAVTKACSAFNMSMAEPYKASSMASNPPLPPLRPTRLR